MFYLSDKVTAFLWMYKTFCIFAVRMSRNTTIFTILIALGVVLLWVDVCSGSIWLNPLSCIRTGDSLFNAESIEHRILFHIRLPKVLTALLAGSALSVSGLLMQTLFRNPLAGPYTLGVSSGASLGVALVTLCTTLVGSAVGGYFSVIVAAIAGSALVLLLVMLVARHVTNNVSLLIVGMMFGSIAGALVNLLQNFANPDALKLFIVWTLGSLSSVGWGQIPYLAAVWLIGMTVCIYLIKPLNGLLLGEGYAQGLGIPIRTSRFLIVFSTGLLAGGVTAFCGPIAFIGVAVPHIAHGLFHTSNHRISLPASALIGADMLLLCDILCSLFTYPLPISTVSALFGAPIIIWIILKRKQI